MLVYFCCISLQQVFVVFQLEPFGIQDLLLVVCLVVLSIPFFDLLSLFVIARFVC